MVIAFLACQGGQNIADVKERIEGIPRLVLLGRVASHHRPGPPRSRRQRRRGALLLLEQKRERSLNRCKHTFALAIARRRGAACTAHGATLVPRLAGTASARKRTNSVISLRSERSHEASNMREA